MPTHTNQPPLPYGNYAPVRPVPHPAWNRQDTEDLDLTQLIQVVRRRGLLIGGVAIAIASVIWGWTLTRTPVYQGRFRVLIESVDETDPSQQLLAENDVQLRETVDYDTQIEVLLSPVLLEPITRELQENYENFTLSQLSSGLSINRLRETKVLEVSYRDSNPQLIQAVLETTAQHYLEYSFEQRQESLKQGIEFVDEQLPELRDRVNELQVRLERFRQQYNLLDPTNRGSDLSELISEVESQRQQLQTELSQARSLYQSLQGQLRVSPEEALAAATLSESPRYQSLLNQMQELEAEIAIESAKYQPNSPQIEILRERRANLEPLLAAEAADVLGDRFTAQSSPQVDGNLTPTSIDLGRQLIEAANDVQMLQARSQTLAQVEQNLKQEFALVPSLARQYTDMQRELEIATESLNRFLTTRETLQIDAAQKSVPWQTIADPTTPRIPISPNIPRNLVLGVVAGLLVGGVAALLAEKLDQVYHSPEELKDSTQLPLLGTIPFYPHLDDQQASSPAAQAQSGDRKKPLTYQASMFFEGFRSLYTNIRFLGTDEPIRSLVISSAIPGEGKTTSALNLARAAAIMGQRVLVVDADLRSPKHHTRMKISNMRGLSTLITSSLRLQDVVQPSPIDENLHILTAGPLHPDPVKLLSSRRMQAVMEQLQTAYDLVIYDMPPILGFADSSLVAAHTDGIVMLVGLGKTERSLIKRALDEIQMSPVSVLGVVANGIKSYTTRTYGYYNYSKYYPKAGAAAEPVASASFAPAAETTSAAATSSLGETSYGQSGYEAQNTSPNPSQTGWQYQESAPQSPSSQTNDPITDDPLQDLPDDPLAEPASGFNGHAAFKGLDDDSGFETPEPDTFSSSPASHEGRASANPSASAETGAGSYGSYRSYPGADAPMPDDEFDAYPASEVSGISDRPDFASASDDTANTQVATMQSRREQLSYAFGRLPIWQKATAGVGVIALVGMIGWTVLSKVTDRLTPPAATSDNNAELSEPDVDANDFSNDTLGEENTPDAAPDTDVANSETSDLPPRPNQQAGDGSGETPDVDANGAGSGSMTPQEVEDPFAEAVRLAEEASAAGETAQTPEEWSRIAEKWQRAAALMAIVPRDDEQFAVARDRTVLYRNNSEFARQKVLQLLRDKDLSYLEESQ